LGYFESLFQWRVKKEVDAKASTSFLARRKGSFLNFAKLFHSLFGQLCKILQSTLQNNPPDCFEATSNPFSNGAQKKEWTSLCNFNGELAVRKLRQRKLLLSLPICVIMG
jgi:hypothetical protein